MGCGVQTFLSSGLCSLPDAEKCVEVGFVKETSPEQDLSWLVTDTN
jgi:hypothetical protein